MSRWQVVALLLCCITIFITTAQSGIGFQTDSFNYMSAAHSLATLPLDVAVRENLWLRWYPPLYPLLLTLLNQNTGLIFGLHVLILAGNLAALLWSLRLAGVLPGISIALLLAVGVSTDFVYLHSIILTEALFLLLMQGSLIALAKNRPGLAALLAGLAALQRYAGVALIGALFVGVVIRRGRGRWRRGLLIALPAVLPLALWLLYTRFTAGQVSTGRTIAFNLLSDWHLSMAVATLGLWFMPAGFALFSMMLLNRLFQRPVTLQPPRLVQLQGIFVGVYLAFMLLSISLFDFTTPLDGRILLPVLVTGSVVMGWGLTQAWQVLLPRHRRILLPLLLLLTGVYILQGLGTTYLMWRNGVGLVEYVRPYHYGILAALPPGTPVYTVYPPTLLAVMRARPDVNIQVQHFPDKYTLWHASGDPVLRPEFEADLNRVVADMRREDGRLVWLTTLNEPRAAELEVIFSRFDCDDYGEMLLCRAKPA
ncbi:MAG: hypothetical protein MUE40_21765 [Anaerolineae bacterium]|nr:hypothetical protein [Anaerolineae bacterium]